MNDIKITLQVGEKKRLLTKDKYCDSDIIVTSEGSVLPELENPGMASDLLGGKQLIDGEGNVITGSMPTLTTLSQYTPNATLEKSVGGDYFNVTGPLYGQGYISHPRGTLTLQKGQLGNTTPDKVFLGTTFTSAEGVCINGTYEPAYELYGSYVLAEHPNLDSLPNNYTQLECPQGSVSSYFLTAEGAYQYSYLDSITIAPYEISLYTDWGLKTYQNITGVLGWNYFEYNSSMDSGPELIISNNKQYLVIDFTQPVKVTQEEYEVFTSITSFADTPFGIGTIVGASGLPYAENYAF